MVKVSYIVALFNKENYIEACLNSILGEMSEDYEVEICIVDDGSTDESYNIVVSEYKKFIDLGLIKVFKFDSNLGKNAAYNKAFTMATGQFICVFGADDIVVQGRTNLMLTKALEKNKSVYGSLEKLNENLTVSYGVVMSKNPNFYEISIDNHLSGGCSLLFRSHLDLIFPIPEHLKFEDWWISYFLVKNNNCISIEDVVTQYRIHGNNDCGAVDSTYENIFKNYSRHIEYIEEFIKVDPENKFLGKSLALRQSFLGLGLTRKINIQPIDLVLAKILLFKLFPSKFIYQIYLYTKGLSK